MSSCAAFTNPVPHFQVSSTISESLLGLASVRGLEILVEPPTLTPVSCHFLRVNEITIYNLFFFYTCSLHPILVISFMNLDTI